MRLLNLTLWSHCAQWTLLCEKLIAITMCYLQELVSLIAGQTALLGCWPAPPAQGASWRPVCKAQKWGTPRRWQQSSSHRWGTEGRKEKNNSSWIYTARGGASMDAICMQQWKEWTLSHLSEDIEAKASRVHHHHSEQSLQEQSHESVYSKHQGIALHVETGCDLISDGHRAEIMINMRKVHIRSNPIIYWATWQQRGIKYNIVKRTGKLAGILVKKADKQIHRLSLVSLLSQLKNEHPWEERKKPTEEGMNNPHWFKALVFVWAQVCF